MANSLQWGYGKMSKCNGSIFLPSTNPLPPADKSKNRARGSLSSPFNASFSPLPSSSDLCSYSSTSPTSPLFPHIRIKLNPMLFLLLYTSFYPHSIPLHILLSYSLHPTLHPHFTLCLPLPHYVFPTLHLHLHLHLRPLTFTLPLSLPLHIPLPHEFCTPLHLHLRLLSLPLPLTLTIFLPLPLHYYQLNLTRYHLHLNHRIQISQCQWLAALMLLLNVSLMWNCGIMAKRWNDEIVKWIGIELWWNKYCEIAQRIHTHVHMVKWWDGEMDWYRAMVKWIWWNGAQNTDPCSHGEMVICWNGAVKRVQRWNGVMVKWLYSPLTAVSFLVPSNDGDLSRLFTSSAAVSSI